LGTGGYGRGVSHNNSHTCAVGTLSGTTSMYPRVAAYWDNGSLTQIPQLSGYDVLGGSASGVSADGGVVVGHSAASTATGMVWKWSPGNSEVK